MNLRLKVACYKPSYSKKQLTSKLQKKNVTNSMSPWCRKLVEKLVVTQMAKNFSDSRNGHFTAVFTKSQCIYNF